MKIISDIQQKLNEIAALREEFEATYPDLQDRVYLAIKQLQPVNAVDLVHFVGEPRYKVVEAAWRLHDKGKVGWDNMSKFIINGE